MPNYYRMKAIFPRKGLGHNIGSDQIGLHSTLYGKLFGREFGKDQGGRPWKRGIVTVGFRSESERPRKVRLLFRGGALKGVDQDKCLIPTAARQLLGIDQEGQEVVLRIEPQWYARFLFYWNHPENHARVAFKLGFTAFVIAIIQLVAGLIGPLLTTFFASLNLPLFPSS